MRVLHLVKTSDGAAWAAMQAGELHRLGVEVHVALPRPEGREVAAWKAAGAVLHFLPCSFPVRRPWEVARRIRGLRELVNRVSPDLVHSHFFETTILLRRALGKSRLVPRIYQVPGPRQMELWFFRQWELSTTGPSDYIVASSRCTLRHYQAAGIPVERLFLSYYGIDTDSFTPGRIGAMRSRLGIDDEAVVVGNILVMYPPYYFLGQLNGPKGHETLIDALGIAIREHPRLVGVLPGGAPGNKRWYENQLRRRAQRAGGSRLKLPGFLPHAQVRDSWGDFDLVLHVPLSENCSGSVVEAMLTEVPVMVAPVGGLPEFVLDGVTGSIVPDVKPPVLARFLLDRLDQFDALRSLAPQGRQVAREMFDFRRTAAEIHAIYRHVLDPSCPRPSEHTPDRAAERVAPRANSLV